MRTDFSQKPQINLKKNFLSYIKELKLSNGQTESGDMFIDASGFAQILMKAVGSKWKSYKENFFWIIVFDKYTFILD